MSYRTRPRGRSRTTGTSRWMDLRYAGTCKVCTTELPAGARAFFDARARTVTCTNIECAKADGLTKSEWAGAPTSGKWVDVLNDHRIGDPAPAAPMVNGRPVEYMTGSSRVFRYVDGGDRWYAHTRYGVRTGHEYTGVRCEDAPCCGCC